MRAEFSFDAPPSGGYHTVRGVFRLPQGEWQARSGARAADGGFGRTDVRFEGGEWQVFTLWCHDLSQFYAEWIDWGERVELLVHVQCTIRRVDGACASGILGHFLMRVFGTRFELAEVPGRRVIEVAGPELADRLTSRCT